VRATRSDAEPAARTYRRRRTPLDPGVEGQLRDRIVRFLEEECLDPDEWGRRLETLEREGGPLAYSILLFVLARLDLPPGRARTCWEQLLGEWRSMNARLGEAVDLRLAVLQYFLRRERKLQNPAIVELRVLHRTEDSAIVDDLTRLYNFRHFQERLHEEVHRAARYQRPLALLMLDADDFKAFNDTYGHQNGDECLQAVAQALRRTLHRPGDLCARYGGEEFAVILPGTDEEGALQVGEALRASVEALGLAHATSPVAATVTVSVGVSTALAGDETTPHGVLRAADKALYESKYSGRNRVCLSPRLALVASSVS
jgi:diguanylate cyclase (GGDEF)-like protein